MDGSRRGGLSQWGSDDTGCHILHVDMDCFFAAVEVLDDPSLRGSPVIVGGAGPRSVVSAASYEARDFGVHSAMPMSQARALCPQGNFRPVRMERYKEISRQIMAYFFTITPLVEQISVDEAFLDVGGARRLWGSPKQIAVEIRKVISSKFSLVASVGVASTKFVAKLASDQAKPNGALLVEAQKSLDFIHSLPLRAIWGVGKATERRLHQLGIDTVAQLAQSDINRLERHLGVLPARQLQALARGQDSRAVEVRGVEKSISSECTFDNDICQVQDLRREIFARAHLCVQRLRAQHLRAGVVGIKLRYADFSTVNRSRTLSAPSNLSREITQVALELLSLVDLRPVRLVGVRLEQLTDGDKSYQLSLDRDEKSENTALAVDKVVSRFGISAIKPATLVDNRGDVDPGLNHHREV